MALQVCVYSNSEAAAFRRGGVIPPCTGHGHVSKRVAEARTGGSNPRAEWLAPRAIVMIRHTSDSKRPEGTMRPKHCTGVDSLPGGPKCPVWQFVR